MSDSLSNSSHSISTTTTNSKKRGRKRSSASNNVPKKKKTRALTKDDLLEAETGVFAKWQDGTVHEAVVLSARENHKEYYVHFVKYEIDKCIYHM